MAGSHPLYFGAFYKPKEDDAVSLLELRKSLDLVSKQKGNIWKIEISLKVRPSLKFCQFAVLRPTRQNRRDPNFFFRYFRFFIIFFGGFRALRSYAENRHQRRRRTFKIISVRPDSKGMSYIPINFRMINSCQNKYFKCIS